MAPPESSADGFTLIEMMVVVMLAAIILAGLFSLQDALLQQRGRILRDISVRNQNDFARRTILRELASATVILSPQPGFGNNDLVGWKNLDPATVVCCGSATYSCISCSLRGTNLRFTIPNPATCGCGNLGATAPRALSTTGAAPENQVQWFRFCLDTTADVAGETPHLVYYRGVDDPLDQLLGLPGEATEVCGTSATGENIGGFAGVRIENTTPASVFNRVRHNWVEINYAAVLANRVRFEGAGVAILGVVDTARAETSIGVSLMASNVPSAAW